MSIADRIIDSWNDQSFTIQNIVDYRAFPNAVLGTTLTHECHKCRNCGCDYVAWRPCTCTHTETVFDVTTLPANYSDIEKIESYLARVALTKREGKAALRKRKEQEKRWNENYDFAVNWLKNPVINEQNSKVTNQQRKKKERNPDGSYWITETRLVHGILKVKCKTRYFWSVEKQRYVLANLLDIVYIPNKNGGIQIARYYQIVR